jgi:basic membrane protein A
MTRLAVALIAVLLAFAAPASAGDAPMKVGLLLSGSATDGGWNQLAKDGSDALKKELGAEVSVLQKVTPDKAGDAMRGYIADGYDLIIAHGYEFLNPAAEAAKAGGKTKIAVSGADVERPGIVTLDFDLSQASYQVGIVAARLSHTGKLGFLGGAKIPSVLACMRGFRAGALSVNGKASVADAYPGWDQPAAAKSQTEAFLQQGVDAIFHDVDAASRGVFEAVKEAELNQDKSAPHWVFGSCADQNANAICPGRTAVSAVIRLDQTFLVLAKSVKDGSFKPGVIREDLARGTCVTVLNPELVKSGVITQAIQDEVAAAGKKLASGEITIPKE